jgi:site-specific DNA recombinase
MNAHSTLPFQRTLGFPALDEVRLAFVGRVSHKDLQDPSLSLPRQVSSTEWLRSLFDRDFIGYYWDIESGVKELDERGHGADGSLYNVPLPRDGGLDDLLRDARSGRFNVVLVEGIDRVARSDASRAVEDELADAGVFILAADEGLSGGSHAILQRRQKQAWAEFYALDLKEKSRNGMKESVRQGWHPGGPAPYGYMLEAHPHPNPNKAREGKKKHRLIVDPITGHVVTLIFQWYVVDGLGYDTIADRLNARSRALPAAAAQQEGRELAHPDLVEGRAVLHPSQPQVHRSERLEPAYEGSRQEQDAPEERLGVER